MRIQNSIKNMFFGISGQVISMLMGFLVRTVFIHTLGAEYLGVEGLFSSILMMLSLANLGFDTAIIYSLYKPLVHKDHRKIQALMNLYKKAYTITGFIVLLIGLMILPFLPVLIKGSTTIKEINLIYMLFLLNSVFSYFLVYKQSILIADQKNYVISKLHAILVIISNTAQIVILILFGNYIFVLLTQIIIRIIENIIISIKANNIYPFLRTKNKEKLSLEERKDFFANLYALFLYKLSGIVINGTDNIVISVLVGLKYVGLYSNYLLILNTLNTFLGYIFYSISASVGNYVVKETKERQYFLFNVLQFSNFWVFGLFTILLWNVCNPVILIWLGKDYILNDFVLAAILLNFFTAGMQNACTTFREATGMFRRGKYRPVIAALINIIVSILLAKTIGIAGVLLGTVVSRICTYFWYDPYILYKFIFQKNVKTYFFKYCKNFILVICLAFLNQVSFNGISTNLFIEILLKVSFGLMSVNFLFFVLYRKSKEFIYLKDILFSIFRQRSNKLFSTSFISVLKQKDEL
ncbi:lipopolysaccharide biosynthesis protein [Fictibacillus enclensis]|uniref:lipopolysaccharide biosynthesis protein n=1 Tax=Fictibacillus enclensis TaxID=1017270 RepID=UPI0024C030CC|nr:oligosaccharide flippase family protein [Fictibacillus enclensis]WHY71036.1 oligosaccharide flippase family protein [Fictibacillus enclensis]